MLQRLWSEDIAPSVRFPFAFDGCQVGNEIHLFYATASHRLFTTRRHVGRPDYRWGERAAAGGNLRLHPFGMLAACTRTNAVHVIAIDEASRLVAMEWQVGDKVWPANAFAIVSGPVVPSSVAIASPSPTEVVAVVVGMDMRPWRYVCRVTGDWSSGSPIGGESQMVLNHARLALTVIDAQTLDFLAMGSDGSPQRYTLTARQDWTATSRVPLLTPMPAGVMPLFQPNPHGDISSVKTPTGRTPVVAFCGVSPGSPAALLSLMTGTAIRLLD
jgi:hypothetical protein